MPNYAKPNDQWLANTLAAARGSAAALSAQQTTYTVDPNGVCQTICGNLQYDHRGNPTTIGNKWGIASFKTGAWLQL